METKCEALAVTTSLGLLIVVAAGLLAVLALQLVVGLTFGRRWCLPCLAYFELVQPRLGEGPLEDSRPPRFANIVGAVVLSAASLAFAAGLDALGTALGGLVAALALLAAVTGPLRRLRGLQARLPAHGQALRLLPAPAPAGAELTVALGPTPSAGRGRVAPGP